MITKIAVVALWAEDASSTAHFYQDVLGLPLQHHAGGDRPHFNLAGTFLTIVKRKPMPPQQPDPPRFPLVAFAVDDLDEMVEHLEKHRIALPWGIEVDEAARWVMFHDLAGNLIELVQFM